jgi:Skp family chaperone for outer membrane proteins
MKRIALSILAAGVAAVATAQTGSPAPAVSAPATAPSSAPAHGPGSIAIINSQRLALESAPGKEAYARLKKLADQRKDELDKVEKEARDLVQKLNDQGQSMPEDKRDALTKQADDKQKAWKRMQEDAQKDLQEAERKEMGALEGRIGPVVKDFFAEKKYAVVLDARSGIIYADPSADVTDEVLKRINTTVALPKPAASNAAPSGAAAQAAKPPAPRATPAPKKQ